MNFHIIYTAKDGKIQTEDKEFETFAKAEDWLESIGATYWEIGMNDQDFNEVSQGEELWKKS